MATIPSSVPDEWTPTSCGWHPHFTNTTAMSLKAKVIESIKWLFAAQLLSQLIRTLVTIFVIRNLEREDMAYVALSLSITSFLEIFSTLGLNAAIISRREVSRKDLQNIFGLVLLINSALILVLLGSSGFLADFYSMPPLASILSVSAISFLLAALRFVPDAMMTREMQFRKISCIRLTASIGSALIAYVSMRNGYGYWSLIYGGIAFELITTTLQILTSNYFVTPRWALKESVHHISFGSFVMGSTLAWYALVTFDLVIAGKFWTPEILGIYAAAVQMVSMPINRILPLLKTVALPAFSRSYTTNQSGLESYVIKSSGLAAFLSVPIFWGMAATSSLFIPLILGPQWNAAALPLAFLCIAAPFRFFLELLTPAVMAMGNPRTIFINTTFIAAVMSTAYLAATTSASSPTLLAGIWLALYPPLVLHATGKYCAAMGIRFGAVIRPALRVVISGLLMLAVVASYTFSLNSKMNDWILLISAILLGGLTYLAGTLLLNREHLRELMNVVRGGSAKAA